MALEGYGLTASGFQRPTLVQIVDDIKLDFTNAFGSELLTTDDSVAGQMAAIIGDRENYLWQLMEESYAQFTIAGAEGIFLDDVVNKFNIFRRGASPSSGVAHVEYDSSVDSSAIIDPSSFLAFGDNGLTYKMSSLTPQNIFDKRAGLKIMYDDVVIGTYTFKIIDTSGSLRTFTYTVNPDGNNEPNDTDIRTMLISLGNLIESAMAIDDRSIVYLTTGGDFYAGYNPEDNSYISLGKTATMYFDGALNIGNFHSAVDVVATQSGNYPLVAFDSTEPQPVGYIGVDTPEVPFSGSDIETDAQLRSRFQNSQQNSGKATRDAIVNALNGVEGVTDVRIYDNPTNDPDYNAADANTFMSVVIGGTAQDIAQAIYDNKPINVSTSGSSTVAIPTADNDNETIKFEVGTSQTLEVSITYVTRDQLPLNSTEEGQIRTSVINAITSYGIGDVISNALILGSVYTAVSVGRFTRLVINMKKTTSPTFTTNDIVMGFEEKATSANEYITFNREIS